MSLQITIANAAYRRRRVLHDIRLDANDGELIALIGRNGCGKSTLISCLASLLPFKGSVVADGRILNELSPRERAAHVGALLQQSGVPHLTVRELVGMGRTPHRGILSLPRAFDEEAVTRALIDADLLPLADHYADRISGGELRRAYFAMLLAQDARNVLLDEAGAFLDAAHDRRLWEMTRLLCARGKSVLCVTHDLSSAIRYADKILLLQDGEQLFFGETDALLETTLIEDTLGVHRYPADGRVFFA